MKRLLSLFFLSLFFLPVRSPAQKTFEFNERCREAYKEIIQLRLRSGQELLNEEKKSNRDNLIPYFLENYIDFFILFFNEDPAEYRSRDPHWNQRLQLMKGGPSSSPFCLFTQSVIHFQKAAVEIKFGNHWDAGWDFRRSFLQNKENAESFPSFSPNSMLGGAMQVAAGTIPDGYKWLSNLLGITGNIGDGMKLMEQFLDSEDSWAGLFHEEAVFYYLYLKYYIENKKEEVFAYIHSNNIDLKNNELFAFLAANLAVNDQQSAMASAIIQGKNNSDPYLDMPVWDMEMGYVQINHLDPSAAIYLERFIQRFKGEFYLKEVLQKLSWYYYLQGDLKKAAQYRTEVLEKGNTDTEADKQALKEAKSGKWPDRVLLKARLLNDGGYYSEALQVLEGKSLSDFRLAEERTEFVYRQARIKEDMGLPEEAIPNYLTTIKLGEGQKEYFAARAALQLGCIYEKRKECPRALAYFKICLDLKDHDYKNSLDQKAKAGMARCREEQGEGHSN
jgi:hypothetical protein